MPSNIQGNCSSTEKQLSYRIPKQEGIDKMASKNSSCFLFLNWKHLYIKLCMHRKMMLWLVNTAQNTDSNMAFPAGVLRTLTLPLYLLFLFYLKFYLLSFMQWTMHIIQVHKAKSLILWLLHSSLCYTILIRRTSAVTQTSQIWWQWKFTIQL